MEAVGVCRRFGYHLRPAAGSSGSAHETLTAGVFYCAGRPISLKTSVPLRELVRRRADAGDEVLVSAALNWSSEEGPNFILKFPRAADDLRPIV
jgi:hypothetical protein